MIEVYLVGCCVAYTRLESIGTVSVGAGGWCLLGRYVRGGAGDPEAR